MQHRYYVLGCGLIATLITIAFAGKIDSSGPTLTEQTLEAIENCIAQSAISWPDEWKKKYIDTIRSEIELHREATHFALRLDILRRGFAPCWEDLTKNKDRALFEVYHCRMRWYVEHLMGTEFPTEDERQKLRNQFADIWNYASTCPRANPPWNCDPPEWTLID